MDYLTYGNVVNPTAAETLGNVTGAVIVTLEVPSDATAVPYSAYHRFKFIWQQVPHSQADFGNLFLFFSLSYFWATRCLLLV